MITVMKLARKSYRHFLSQAAHYLLLTAFLFGASGLGALISTADSASAAGGGETAKWIGQFDISISGGHFQGAREYHWVDNDGDGNHEVAQMSGNTLIDTDNGTCNLILNSPIPDTDKNTIKISVYSGATSSPVGGPPRCEGQKINGKSIEQVYNTTYTMTNPRPTGGAPEETAEQRVYVIYVCSYLNDSPASVSYTTTIGGKNGSGTANTDNSAPLDNDCKKKYKSVLSNINPGQVKVCVTLNGKEQCDTGTKVKYQPGSASTFYFGNSPEIARDKIIGGSLRIEGLDKTNDDPFTPDNLDEDIDFGTYKLDLFKSDGTLVESQEVNVKYDGSQCREDIKKATGWVCKSPASVSGYYEFKNVTPGKYKVCVSGTKKCVDVTKKRSERITNADISLTIDEAMQYDTSGALSGKNSTNCAIDGIGWMICPVMTFIADLNDRAYGFLSQNFLQFDIKLLQDQGAKTAWDSFKNIANVVFVIFFLLIIYSQITGGGFTNYGIKRMLPRVIIAAILVNLSFFICQIAVDVSNILGNAVADFLGKSIQTTPAGSATTANTDLPLWKDMIGGVLIVGTVAIGLALAFAIGLPGLLVLILIVLALIIRKAVLLLLIVVSPLAFVAYLLPNTEDWFKKWWKLFYTLLMVYPIIGLLFGASALAARIINTTANGDILIQLTALGVSVLPLFAVPVVLKTAMNGIGSIGARISGSISKAQGAAGGSAKDSYNKSAFERGRQLRKQGREGYKNMKFADAVSGEDTKLLGRLRRRASRGITGRTFTSSGEFAAKAATASAVAASHKAADEAVDHEEALLSGITPDALVARLGQGTAIEQAAVIRRIAKTGGDQHVQAAYDHLMTSTDQHKGDVQQLSASALLSRKPAGLGTSEAQRLSNGQLGVNSDGTFGGPGYMNSLKNRIGEQKMTAKDWAGMGTDDLIRVAELASSGKLGAADLQHINDQYNAIMADETLKGSMSGERQKLYENIAFKQAPQNADGTPRRPLVPLS